MHNMLCLVPTQPFKLPNWRLGIGGHVSIESQPQRLPKYRGLAHGVPNQCSATIRNTTKNTKQQKIYSSKLVDSIKRWSGWVALCHIDQAHPEFVSLTISLPFCILHLSSNNMIHTSCPTAVNHPTSSFLVNLFLKKNRRYPLVTSENESSPYFAVKLKLEGEE